MIDESIKTGICQKAKELQDILPGYYGKIVLNYSNGLFVVANVEQSIRDNPKNGSGK